MPTLAGRRSSTLTAPTPVAGVAGSAAPPIMRRLREHTAAAHAATEELPLMRDLLVARPTTAGYARYLSTLHAVYLAVEPALYAALPAPTLTRLGIAPKLPALQEDLLALTATSKDAATLLPDPGVCNSVRGLLDCAHPHRAAAALGGLYVLEGATLGGQVIARHLRTHWASDAEPPTAFLDFRAAQPGHGWRAFGAAVTAWTEQHPDAERAILDGALAIFEMMHAAFAAAGQKTTEDTTANP